MDLSHFEFECGADLVFIAFTRAIRVDAGVFGWVDHDDFLSKQVGHTLRCGGGLNVGSSDLSVAEAEGKNHMVKNSAWSSRFHPAFYFFYAFYLAACWLAGSLFFEEIHFTWFAHLRLTFGWALASSVTTLFILDLLEFFDPVRYIPQRRNVLTLALITPVVGMFWKYFFFTFDGIPVARYREILFVAPFVAGMAYFFQWIIWYHFNRNGIKVRVVAALSAAQQQRLNAALQDCELPNFIEFQNFDGLQPEEVHERNFDWVIYSRAILRDLKADSELVKQVMSGLPAVEWRSLLMTLERQVDLEVFDTWTLLQYSKQRGTLSKAYEIFKLVFEPFVALLLFVILSPLFLIVAMAILISSRGPIVYAQTRSGLNDRPFKLYKFRTMREDAERSSGPTWSREQDTRITTVGKILRKTRLDELPQLFNIMKLEMSFVGPRPERPEFCATLEKSILLFGVRTAIKPGVTGWAQVHYGYAGSVEESRRKLGYDVYYILNQSLWLDLTILLKTLALFYRGGGTGR